MGRCPWRGGPGNQWCGVARGSAMAVVHQAGDDAGEQGEEEIKGFNPTNSFPLLLFIPHIYRGVHMLIPNIYRGGLHDREMQIRLVF